MDAGCKIRHFHGTSATLGAYPTAGAPAPARCLVPRFLLPPSARIFLTLALSLAFVPYASAAGHDDYRYQETHSDAREFVPGGSLHIRMRVGDLHINHGEDNKIHLRYTVKSQHENNVKDVRVDLDVHGSDATLELQAHGSNTAFDVDVEVPANTNLDVHQKVGDLTVDGVEGNKDLELGVGDIRVSPQMSGYRTVHASSGIGDVNSGGIGETRGWLGKTLRYHGEGKYDFRAHVGVGDINLEAR